MIISDKIITIYRNGKGIYEVLAELEKGAQELSKYTLEEQMELIKKREKEYGSNYIRNK